MKRPSRTPASTSSLPSGARVAEAPAESSELRSFAVGGVVFVALVAAAYSPLREASYVWDDDQYVVENRNLRDASGLKRIWLEPRSSPQYYPLVHTTFWLEYRLWGLRPLGYHVVNVALHALNALLAWRILSRWRVPGAWFVAALFAVHPVHVESVAWITERKNTLSGAFYLATLLAYSRWESANEGRGGTLRGYCGVVLLFVAALWSKTIVATLPAALLLFAWWRRGAIAWRDVLRVAPLLAVAAPLAMTTAWLEKHHVGALGADWEFSPVERVLIAGRAAAFYAGQLASPRRLTFIYPRWEIDASDATQYLFPLAVFVAIGLLWGGRRRLGRGPLTALLFFLGTLAPALGFFDVFPMRYSFVADHFQYLASLGLLTLAPAVVLRALRAVDAERAARPLAVVTLLALAGLTWQQCHAYRDAETLWRDTLGKNPQCEMAHTNLGLLLRDRGDLAEAREHFDAALAIHPDQAIPHNNLATVLAAAGDRAGAIEQLRTALRLEPGHADSQANLGVLLSEDGRHDEALEQLGAAVAANPREPWYSLQSARALLRAGRAAEAEAECRRMLELRPDYVPSRIERGRALKDLGRIDEARRLFDEVLREFPESREAAEELKTLDRTPASGGASALRRNHR